MGGGGRVGRADGDGENLFRTFLGGGGFVGMEIGWEGLDGGDLLERGGGFREGGGGFLRTF